MQDFTSRNSSTARPAALSVGELNLRAKRLLETHLNPIWVEGEISNFSRPSSGHWYFSLKDSKAQVRCAMFRNRNLLLTKLPKAGDQVLVRGRISLYEARGDFQLIAEHMEDAGEGLLQKQFEALKLKLANEGLFDEAFKKPLPRYVSRVAVITSATGAALHDILHVLKRRNSSIEVDIVPASVQGEDAPAQLINALNLTEQHLSPDVIILGRGGGSLEDLWAFNDEALARRIFSTDIPIVSAVGHEIDFSITDFVADLRAPTPSAAAELVSGDQASMRQALQTVKTRLIRAISLQTEQAKAEQHFLTQRLKHPGDKLIQWQQRTDICEQRIKRAVALTTEKYVLSFRGFNERLQRVHPATQFANNSSVLQALQHRLMLSMSRGLALYQTNLAHTASALDIVSPLSTMKRGYSLTRDPKGRILKSIDNVQPGDGISVQLQDGEFTSTVNSISKNG